MNKIFYLIIGILFPFIGTSFGSLFVFFLKDKINFKVEKLLIGFSCGIMISSSIFSLIIPSIKLSGGIFSCVVGFIFGILFLLLVEKIILKKDNMLVFSITLHNIPEGLCVGVIFAGFLLNTSMLIDAYMLSLGIALQNIPEGFIISMPLKLNGKSKVVSFIYGVLSGIVEPICAFGTLLFLKYVVLSLPYLLSFAAGSMIYVSLFELFPQIKKNKYGIFGIIIGFIIMMLLDILFS